MEAETELFVTLPAEDYITGVTGKAVALQAAAASILKRLRTFDYENQLLATEW